MGLASEVKNLSEEILASFKQRIKDNEELVNDVQKTLDGFRKDHQEMAAVLNANAAALRTGLALGEKERLNTYHELMTDIHQTITSVQKEVGDIQSYTLNMIKEFTSDRSEMAAELNKFFSENRTGRQEDEKSRMAEFDSLMKEINDDIKSINDEVMTIFKNTNEMLDTFGKEHKDMSAELRAELNKNLAERVKYTRSMLAGFQKRLSEISKENQKAAQKLRKDLSKGETERITEYNGVMKGIHTAIVGIRKEVMDIHNATARMLDDLTQDRGQATAEWNKMQDSIAKIRKSGTVSAPKEAKKAVEKKTAPKETPAETVKEVLFAPVMEEPQVEIPAPAAIVEEPKTLEQKVLDYINKHPKGAKVSEMEDTLGETRMKLGYTAKVLLDEGKVQKIDNIYFPLK
ncbi:MAG: hypothetical protein WCR72_17665 [Bacteroidota bacterium]